jgi:hypothetical protein
MGRIRTRGGAPHALLNGRRAGSGFAARLPSAPRGPMKFCCFNNIPWPFITKRPEVWPFPNRDFDPERARDHYRAQIDQLVLAEKRGFDWLAIGEDHMTAYSLTPNGLRGLTPSTRSRPCCLEGETK